MAKAKTPKQISIKIKSLKKQIIKLERAKKKAEKKRKYYYSKKSRRG